MLYFEDVLQARIGLSDRAYSFVEHGVYIAVLMVVSYWVARMLGRI